MLQDPASTNVSNYTFQLGNLLIEISVFVYDRESKLPGGERGNRGVVDIAHDKDFSTASKGSNVTAMGSCHWDAIDVKQ